MPRDYSSRESKKHKKHIEEGMKIDVYRRNSHYD